MFNNIIGGKEMKKVFFIAILGALMTSCVPNPGPNDEIAEPKGYIYYKGVSGSIYGEPVYRFDYNGHQYIRFGEYQSVTVVHDPDCKCHKSNNNNNLFDW
jgi:hypothetical protein